MTISQWDVRKDLEESLKEVDHLSLQLTATRQGEANLYDPLTQSSFHSSYSAKREAEQLLKELPTAKPAVLYIYGIGLAHSYPVLLPWLKSHPGNYIVYLEDDPRVLKHLLAIDEAKALFDDEQVLPILMEGNFSDIADELAYYFVKMPFNMLALPYYKRVKEGIWSDIRLKIMHATAHVNYSSNEFLSHGAPFFKNFYHNVLQLKNSFQASSLFAKFEQVPAIIVGAGPSLNLNFDVLNTLSEKALIFAGGSAITALTARGLTPHFGASVDPNTEQYHRMSRQSGHEIPFFYKTRVHHRSLRTLHGPRLYLPGNSCYPISDWIDEQLNIDKIELSEGHNVLHLLIDVARLMGCNPIIFVGMDLAYSELNTYATGVVDHPQVSEAEITKSSHLNDNAFLRKGFDGKPVYTLWKWVAEASFTAKYAQDHPETTFINATEGGLGIEGIPHLPLAQVADLYLKRSRNLQDGVFKEIQMASFDHFTENDVIELLKRLQESLERAIELLQQLIEHLEALKEAIEKDRIEQLLALTGKIKHDADELSKEVAYEQILTPVSHVRAVMMNREFEEIERNQNFKDQKAKMLQYAQNNLSEYCFLRECAQVNLAFVQDAFTRYLEKAPLHT